MDSLIEGYRKFRVDVWPGQRARYEAMCRADDRPKALVVACSDSRVDPQTIFNSAPGELFVIRNLGALVPPYQPDASYHGTSAALEYAVRVLKVARIAVLGHAQCGGVKAMVNGAPRQAPDFVAHWMELAEPVLWPEPPRLETGDAPGYYEGEVVKLSLTNLRTFPWVADAERTGRLKLDGFRFDIRTGVLTALEGCDFMPVA